MKNKFTLLSILAAAMVFAQQDDPYRGRVGINTTTPNATLEVAGNPNDISAVDGIIFPKISRDDLIRKMGNYGSQQMGAVVYATSPMRTNNNYTNVRNIQREGLYVYNKNEWEPLLNEFIKYGNGYSLRERKENSGKYNNHTPLGMNAIDFSTISALSVDNNYYDGKNSTGAKGENSFVTGINNSGNGGFSTIFGRLNTSNGNFNFILGEKNVANSWYGALIGKKLTSHSPLSVIIGQHNKEETNYDWNNIRQKSELFVLANGLSKASEGHNAFTMWFSGLFKYGMYDINNKKNAMVNEGFIMEKGIHGADLDGKLNTWNGEQWEKYVTMTFSTTAPLSPKQGDLYFNTTDKKYYAYDGTDWQPMW